MDVAAGFASVADRACPYINPGPFHAPVRDTGAASPTTPKLVAGTSPYIIFLLMSRHAAANAAPGTP